MKKKSNKFFICIVALCLGILFNQCEKDRTLGYAGTIYENLSNSEQENNNQEHDGIVGTVMDYDGNTYSAIRLGTQVWMASNLKTTHYANGTYISPGFNYSSSTTAYRYYPAGNSSNSNVSLNGYLYNWKAVMGNSSSSNSNPSHVQGICPTGWHVPSVAEWNQLAKYLGSQPQYVCGGNSTYIAKSLAYSSGWINSNNAYAVGNIQSNNNSTQFSARPAGYFSNPYYYSINEYAMFATSTEESYGNMYYFYLSYKNAYLGNNSYIKEAAMSVRCVRD